MLLHSANSIFGAHEDISDLYYSLRYRMFLFLPVRFFFCPSSDVITHLKGDCGLVGQNLLAISVSNRIFVSWTHGFWTLCAFVLLGSCVHSVCLFNSSSSLWLLSLLSFLSQYGSVSLGCYSPPFHQRPQPFSLLC